MTVALSASLIAHQQARARRPILSAQVFATRAGNNVHRWTRIYSGSEPDAPHAAAAVASGPSLYLIRARNAAGTLYTSSQDYNASPSWSSWTSHADAISSTRPIALAAVTAEALLLFTTNSGLTLNYKRSTDNGATWSAAAALVTEAVAINALAVAINPAGNVCAFYTLDGTSTLKRLRRTSGTWDAAGTNWTKSASVSSLSGIAAAHDGGDFALLITGYAVTTNVRNVWATRMGDLNLPLNAWGSLKQVVDSDALSTTNYRAPALAMSSSDAAAFFTHVETAAPAYTRCEYTQPVHLLGVQADWSEPAPFEAGGSYGVALAATATRVFAAQPGGVWHAPIGDYSTLTAQVLACDYQITPTSSRCSLTMDDKTGATYAALATGNTLRIIPGYGSGAAAAFEGGIIQDFIIRRITRQLAAGTRTITIDADGAWEQLDRWHAPQAWLTAAGVRTRESTFQRVAARAGLFWITGSSPAAPSSDWSAYSPAFAIASGESGATVLKRLLAVVTDYIRPNGGTLETIGTVGGAVAQAFTSATPYELTYQTGAAQPHNWTRVQGPDRYADSITYADIYAHGPTLDVVRNLDAGTDAKVLAFAANAAVRAVQERPFGTLTAPFHAGLQLYDHISVTDARLGTFNARIFGIALRYRRGAAGPVYDSVLTLGGPNT